MDHQQIVDLIHARDPYEGFDAERWPLDLRGWYGDDPSLVDYVRDCDPAVLVEVGSWKGLSACSFAAVMRAGSTIVCVDTWLGANEFWVDKTDPDRYQALALVNGYPSVYYQFLANMVHRGVQDKVVPFPLPSVQAARHLARGCVAADLTYVDASHEEDDVLADLRAFWPISTVVVGDDYDQVGVRAAVDRFALDVEADLDWLDEARHFWKLERR